MDVYRGLFNATTFAQDFNVFIYLVSGIILIFTALYPKKVYIKQYLSLHKLLTFQFLYNKIAM